MQAVGIEPIAISFAENLLGGDLHLDPMFSLDIAIVTGTGARSIVTFHSNWGPLQAADQILITFAAVETLMKSCLQCE